MSAYEDLKGTNGKSIELKELAIHLRDKLLRTHEEPRKAIEERGAKDVIQANIVQLYTGVTDSINNNIDDISDILKEVLEMVE